MEGPRAEQRSSPSLVFSPSFPHPCTPGPSLLPEAQGQERLPATFLLPSFLFFPFHFSSFFLFHLHH